MGTITTKMIEASYLLGQEVHYEGLQKTTAISQLASKYNMNRSSAHDYIDNFRHMRLGEVYKRTNSLKAVEIYLHNIRKDYGIKGLKNALSALDKHIVYYANLTGGDVLNRPEFAGGS